MTSVVRTLGVDSILSVRSLVRLFEIRAVSSCIRLSSVEVDGAIYRDAKSSCRFVHVVDLEGDRFFGKHRNVTEVLGKLSNLYMLNAVRCPYIRTFVRP